MSDLNNEDSFGLLKKRFPTSTESPLIPPQQRYQPTPMPQQKRGSTTVTIMVLILLIISYGYMLFEEIIFSIQPKLLQSGYFSGILMDFIDQYWCYIRLGLNVFYFVFCVVTFIIFFTENKVPFSSDLSQQRYQPTPMPQQKRGSATVTIMVLILLMINYGFYGIGGIIFTILPKLQESGYFSEILMVSIYQYWCYIRLGLNVFNFVFCIVTFIVFFTGNKVPLSSDLSQQRYQPTPMPQPMKKQIPAMVMILVMLMVQFLYMIWWSLLIKYDSLSRIFGDITQYLMIGVHILLVIMCIVTFIIGDND